MEMKHKVRDPSQESQKKPRKKIIGNQVVVGGSTTVAEGTAGSCIETKPGDLRS